ncbi:hypothetical protein F4803DRAFT_372 [Xylaria telfairii]|nr:hypothetical protein F4803DRAFT_372 [Xylaria telfairii]
MPYITPIFCHLHDSNFDTFILFIIAIYYYYLFLPYLAIYTSSIFIYYYLFLPSNTAIFCHLHSFHFIFHPPGLAHSLGIESVGQDAVLCLRVSSPRSFEISCNSLSDPIARFLIFLTGQPHLHGNC